MSMQVVRALRHTQIPKPPWARRRKASRAGRYIDWIQRYVVVPSGRGMGKPLKLAPFQRETLEILLASGAQGGAMSIPAGNAKSTLTAAVGLCALASEPDSPQVPLLAINGMQATGTLLLPIQAMVLESPVLCEHLKIRFGANDRGITSPWNHGNLQTLPATHGRLQGLNPTVAIIDEAEEVPFEILKALEDRLGKRAEAVVLCIGTPGALATSALASVRQLHAAGADYRMVEYAAAPDADLQDPAAWRKANPAIDAGILGIEAIERDAQALKVAPEYMRPVLEQRFRRYRLGMWLAQTAEDGWLPFGAWEGCPVLDPPPHGSPIVLAVDGTYRHSTAVVGASLDTGAVFLLWAGERATTPEVEEHIDEAYERYDVTELVMLERLRPELYANLDRKAYPLLEWDATAGNETSSTNALYQAITEGRFVHDGSPLLAEHFRNVATRDTATGTRLRRIHPEGYWIDAAMAARAAWWRVQFYVHHTPGVF